MCICRWAQTEGSVRAQERPPGSVGPTLRTLTSSRRCYWALQHRLRTEVRIRARDTHKANTQTWHTHTFFNNECLRLASHRWHVAGKSECSAKCGPGYRSLDVQCMKYSLMKRQSERAEASACESAAKPPARESCHGDCLLKSWQYSAWSQVQLQEACHERAYRLKF